MTNTSLKQTFSKNILIQMEILSRLNKWLRPFQLLSSWPVNHTEPRAGFYSMRGSNTCFCMNGLSPRSYFLSNLTSTGSVAVNNWIFFLPQEKQLTKANNCQLTCKSFRKSSYLKPISSVYRSMIICKYILSGIKRLWRHQWSSELYTQLKQLWN